MIWIFSILGDRAANVDITWYHWPCNIDITKNRFYMAARIDKIVISELAATAPRARQTLAALGLEEHVRITRVFVRIISFMFLLCYSRICIVSPFF